MAIYVNVGCGNRFHPDWINIDMVAMSPEVMAHDLTNGIPLASNYADCVYHSHVLEHFKRNVANSFMTECYRVLKPGGVLRVAVPDLEQICRLYLEKLQNAVDQMPGTSSEYEWIVLELYDQMIRERSGGEMAGHLSQKPIPAEAFVYERSGEEARNLVRMLHQQATEIVPAQSLLKRLKNLRHKNLTSRLVNSYTRLMGKLFLGRKGAESLEIGLFRKSGEIHQWMYDRYSLAQLMKNVGFVQPQKRTATESSIADWSRFNLDTLADGTVVKPDSLFMETTKPN